MTAEEEYQAKQSEMKVAVLASWSIRKEKLDDQVVGDEDVLDKLKDDKDISSSFALF